MGSVLNENEISTLSNGIYIICLISRLIDGRILRLDYVTRIMNMIISQS